MIDAILTMLEGQSKAVAIAQVLVEGEQHLETLWDDLQAILDIIDGIEAKAEARGWTDSP